MKRVLFTGGRDYHDTEIARKLFLEVEPDVVIVGDAKGADEMIRVLAKEYYVPLFMFFAEWARLGKSAGAIRNAQMIAVGQPTQAIAFPGGSGTSNMMKLLKANKIPFNVYGY